MLDDNRLHYLRGLERRLGQPELLSAYQDGVYEGWGDPMIFPVNRSDPHTGYRLIYSATPTQDLILMLESEDATHWAPADLSGYPTREPGGGSSHSRTMINEVMRVQWSPGSPDGGGGMCGAFDDEGPDTPPAERFKMLIMDGKVLASPDAIVWSGAPPTPFRLRNVDARSKANLCFRRAPERHLAGQRSRHGRRAAGLRLLRAHRAALRLHLARAPWRPPRLPPLHARRRCFLNFAALAVSLT